MTVSDNTILAEGSGHFFEPPGQNGANKCAKTAEKCFKKTLMSI